MFARVLLILTVAIGLLAGPAWTREACLAATQIKECHCCPMPGEACCVRESQAPARSTPAQAAPVSADVRDLIAPVLVLIGTPPETGAAGFGEAASAGSTAIPSIAVIDRICVRLI